MVLLGFVCALWVFGFNFDVFVWLFSRCLVCLWLLLILFCYCLLLVVVYWFLGFGCDRGVCLTVLMCCLTVLLFVCVFV